MTGFVTLLRRISSCPVNEQRTFKFKGEDFFVDGKLIVERIKAPTLQEVSKLSFNQRQDLDLLTFFVSDVREEQHSKFQAFAATALSFEHIWNCYLKMRKDHPTASHICLGYHLDDEDGTPLQGGGS